MGASHAERAGYDPDSHSWRAVWLRAGRTEAATSLTSIRAASEVLRSRASAGSGHLPRCSVTPAARLAQQGRPFRAAAEGIRTAAGTGGAVTGPARHRLGRSGSAAA